jgi:hypothetical protein
MALSMVCPERLPLQTPGLEMKEAFGRDQGFGLPIKIQGSDVKEAFDRAKKVFMELVLEGDAVERATNENYVETLLWHAHELKTLSDAIKADYRLVSLKKSSSERPCFFLLKTDPAYTLWVALTWSKTKFLAPPADWNV